jgi:hypothetical protein
VEEAAEMAPTIAAMPIEEGPAGASEGEDGTEHRAHTSSETRRHRARG